jgi:hypothetical protein
MKKLSIILTGIIFTLSTTGLALAQEKAKAMKPAELAKPAESAKAQAARPERAKPEVPKKARKKARARPVKYRMGGVVTAIDATAKKITIKQSNAGKITSNP